MDRNLAGTLLAALLAILLADRAAASNNPVIYVIGQSSCSYDSASLTYDCTVSNADQTTVVNVNNGQISDDSITTSTTVTISGTGSIQANNNYNTGFFYAGWGQQKNETYGGSNGFTNGGNITISVSGSQTVSQDYAENLQYSFEGTAGDGYQNVYWGSGVGALVGLSIGGGGVTENSDTDIYDYDGGSGGRVEITNTGSFTAIFGSQSITDSNIPNVPVSGSAIAALSFGGNGTSNKTNDTDYAGGGGAGGNVTVTNQGSIAASSDLSVPTIGILAVSQGGVGSNQKNYATAPGGNGGSVTVTHDGSISVDAPQAVGIFAASLGGNSNFDDKNGGGDASGAGNGGSTTVTLNSGSTITFSGGGAGIGVLAISAGGNADNSWQGEGGSAIVTVDSGAEVDTTGAGGSLSIGVLAISAGALGDILPFGSTSVNSAYPGSAGDATVNNYGTVTTYGSMAAGVAALSIGGAAIVTNSDGSSSVLGNVADGFSTFDGSTATVNNTGSITTLGGSAFGILAQSVGGGGGLINLETSEQNVSLGSQTSGDTGKSNAGAVTVTHSGNIVTGDGSGAGNAAIGIVAQSIGGGGGSSDSTSLLGGYDVTGSGGGNGGAVTITTSGSSTITTYDTNALGILAQSIGGGGGNGGNAGGLFVAAGGAGGAGGNGGEVTVDLDNEGAGLIATYGDFSAGVYAQSVGGGGGNGGGATAVGTVISVGTGGTGGSGGYGGGVTVTSDTTIVSQGNQALGILAQSIGGGGGTGGAAYAYSAGVLTTSIAMGGAGGDGGNGGAVSVSIQGEMFTGCQFSETGCGYAVAGAPVTIGADSIGILAQSIGGGGGAGGSATASSFSLPSDDIPVEFSLSYAVGGSGGSGGDAGDVTVDHGGLLVTGGDGSYGILAQSIGGGGGNAGDATASSYALESAMPTIKMALAIGGSGGSGGSGGAVDVTLGPTSDCSTCNGEIYTYGHYAHGILAQSISGGGGSGGTGDASASSQNFGLTTGTSVDLTFGVGGAGGSSNSDGSVTVTVDAGSGIYTYGSSAKGIVAQAIGGGGGAAGGGSAAASGDTFQANISIGGSGGSGADGGMVTVTNLGTIVTGSIYTNESDLSVVMGGDSFGIFAQSIGGGGGAGGTSDAAANIDIVGQVEDALNQPGSMYSADISVGGSGGAGGDGGVVQVTNEGSIQTLGQRAHGIFAQSIGGGGGYAGSATSTSNLAIGTLENPGTFSADVSISGNGGDGGTGGTVDISNSGSILTAGYGAHAIFAQSVGGGGGYGAEGTVGNIATIGLALDLNSGSKGSSGEGGAISVTDSGTLWTAGDDAYAILAQSVGGGGGSASLGCTNSVQVGPTGNSQSLCLGNSQIGNTVSDSVWTDTSEFTAKLGVATADGSYGGNVTISKTGGAIITTGARASAIVAQSIGGGGGLFAASAANISEIELLVGGGGEDMSGGTIDVTLDTGASISTYGDGAFGVLAQSIAGGGGFAGDSSLTLTTTDVNNASAANANFNGGIVEVTTSADIATSGSNAHGLFLQSLAVISSGVIGVGDTLVAGSDLSDTQSTGGIAGAIIVNQTGGSIVASGEGSAAIFAQTSGNATQQNPITISLSGTVQGGSGASAAGIWVSGGLSGGGTSQTNGVAANSITINAGGSLSTADGIDGMAILAEESITNVVNAGTLTGSVNLGSQSYDSSLVVGTITNSGLFNSGSEVTAASLGNSGTLAVGGAGTILTTTLSGSYTQSSTGMLAVDIDAIASPTVDLLAVTGSASFDGTIQPTASALLPGSYTVANSDSLTSTATVPSSYLFTWDVDATTTSLAISPDADLTTSGAGLTTNQQALANYLQAAWDAGGSSGLAPLFGTLSQVQDASTYTSDLNSLLANVPTPAVNQVMASAGALDSAFSCPVFSSKEGIGTLLVESDCQWSSVTGGAANFDGGSDSAGYELNDLSFRVGAQVEVAPDWYVGSTAAYTRTWTDFTDGSATGSGQRGDAGLSLKHTIGPWYLAGGFNIGYGAYEYDRVITTTGTAYNASSSPDVLTVAGRLRAAYEFAFPNWYLRPHVDLDMIYVDTLGYSESSLSPLAYKVAGRSDMLFGLSTMLEMGGRVDLSSGWTLRPYASAGVSLLSQDSWVTTASLQGAPEGIGSFDIVSNLPDTLLRLDLGLQLFQERGLEMRAVYGLATGDDYLSNSGSLRLAHRF